MLKITDIYGRLFTPHQEGCLPWKSCSDTFILPAKSVCMCKFSFKKGVFFTVGISRQYNSHRSWILQSPLKFCLSKISFCHILSAICVCTWPPFLLNPPCSTCVWTQHKGKCSRHERQITRSYRGNLCYEQLSFCSMPPQTLRESVNLRPWLLEAAEVDELFLVRRMILKRPHGWSWILTITR